MLTVDHVKSGNALLALGIDDKRYAGVHEICKFPIFPEQRQTNSRTLPINQNI